MSLLLVMLDRHDGEEYSEVEDTKELETTLNRYYAEGLSLLEILDDTRKETFFVVKFEENEIYIRTPEINKEIDHWFVELARTLAFNDCSEERVIYIMYQGKELHYVGWQPGMTYEFADKKGNIIWSASFPEWDH